MEIFEYIFMRKAFLAGIIVAVIIPCVGVVIALKRLSMIGDAFAYLVGGRGGGPDLILTP